MGHLKMRMAASDAELASQRDIALDGVQSLPGVSRISPVVEREELLLVGQLVSLVVCPGSMTLVQVLLIGFQARDFRLLGKVSVQRRRDDGFCVYLTIKGPV